MNAPGYPRNRDKINLSENTAVTGCSPVDIGQGLMWENKTHFILFTDFVINKDHQDNWFYTRRLLPCLDRWPGAMGALLISFQQILLNEKF